MLVDSEDGPENYVWQSFDHPGNTLMPEMKFGRDLKRGIVTNYTSWKSDDDPSPGPFMIYMDYNGYPQTLENNGDKILYRLGSWNGITYSGNTNNHQFPMIRNWFSMDEFETWAIYVLNDKSVLTRLTLSVEGNMGLWNWNNRTQRLSLYSSLTTDSYERYALCGVYGFCNIAQSPNCGCLSGFKPKRPDQWEIADWKSGCQREIPLDCGAGEGFRKYPFIKLPDTRQSWFDKNMSLDQCRMKCTNQCNCTAYATLDIKKGIGCMLWYNELIDMRILPNNRQDIYIRMSAAELEKDNRSSRSKKKVWAIIISVSIGLFILIGTCVMIFMKKKKKEEVKAQVLTGRSDSDVPKDSLDIPLFRLSTLTLATDNFSIYNKLGEGGFGPVYKDFWRMDEKLQ